MYAPFSWLISNPHCDDKPLNINGENNISSNGSSMGKGIGGETLLKTDLLIVGLYMCPMSPVVNVAEQ